MDIGSSISWLLGLFHSHNFGFWALPYFQSLKDSPRLSCLFLFQLQNQPVLQESLISFIGDNIRDKHSSFGSAVATRMSLLLDHISWQTMEIYIRIHISINIFICVHLYLHSTNHEFILMSLILIQYYMDHSSFPHLLICNLSLQHGSHHLISNHLITSVSIYIYSIFRFFNPHPWEKTLLTKCSAYVLLILPLVSQTPLISKVT